MIKHHPEQLNDEIFMGNFESHSKFDKNRCGWNSLRIGDKAYSTDGSVISYLHPGFIKVQEVNIAIMNTSDEEKRRVWQEMIDRGSCL